MTVGPIVDSGRTPIQDDQLGKKLDDSAARQRRSDGSCSERTHRMASFARGSLLRGGARTVQARKVDAPQCTGWLVGVADRRPARDVGRDGDPRSDDEVNVPERGSVLRFSDVLATVTQKTEAPRPHLSESTAMIARR